MYQRILLPTDGSAASRRAIDAGVAFAGELGAEVVGFHATPPFHVVTTDAAMLEDTPEHYVAASRARARRVLEDVELTARAAGVMVRLEHAIADHPYAAIIDCAQRLGCDLICMASHGSDGIKALLLGGETQKVLVHSRIPVLVHH